MHQSTHSDVITEKNNTKTFQFISRTVLSIADRTRQDVRTPSGNIISTQRAAVHVITAILHTYSIAGKVNPGTEVL